MTDERVADVLTHPAVRTWQAVDSGGRIPALVELIKGNQRPRTIWRLTGAGLGESAVIAKRCPRHTAALERQVYERILPQLPVSAPDYYGYVEEDEQHAWIFLEDVGRERISLTDDTQRKLAARWLGMLHAAAVDVIGPDELPDRGTPHYRRLLATGRASLEAGRHNPTLRAGERRTLEAVLRLLDVVEEEWSAVEEFSRVLPRTFVHGDFRPKNILVRKGRKPMQLFAIDWEFSGWGLVAPDLAPSRGPVLEPQVDLPTYVSVVREQWPDLDMASFRAQVTAGGILRRLAAVEWAARSLGYPNLVKPVGQLETYLFELQGALSNAPWRGGRAR